MEGEADHDVDFEIDPNHIQLLGGTILIDPVLIFPQVQTKFIEVDAWTGAFTGTEVTGEAEILVDTVLHKVRQSIAPPWKIIFSLIQFRQHKINTLIYLLTKFASKYSFFKGGHRMLIIVVEIMDSFNNYKFTIFFFRKLQEWCVSEDIIENFRRENIQGRHLNYLTEYMIKKGLLSNRTEQETPENVRPLAARLGPLKTVCRALKMHVGQAKGKIEIFPTQTKKIEL